MLHPDYQYDATRIPALIEPILGGEADLMLGSRFLGDPLAGGMPRWKYVSNRFLTIVENLAFGLHLSEYHTGLRAYSRPLLETIPYRLNSDDFVFDQELIAQVVAAGDARRIGEIARADPLLRGGELGRLPAERRLRPLDAACRAPIPAPPGGPAALAQADGRDRPTARPRPDRVTVPIRASIRAVVGAVISIVAIWLVLRSVDLGRTATSCGARTSLDPA